MLSISFPLNTEHKGYISVEIFPPWPSTTENKTIIDSIASGNKEKQE